MKMLYPPKPLLLLANLCIIVESLVVDQDVDISQALLLFKHCYIEVHTDSMSKNLKFPIKIPISMVTGSVRKEFGLPGMYGKIQLDFSSHYLIKWPCLAILSLSSNYGYTAGTIRQNAIQRHSWIKFDLFDQLLHRLFWEKETIFHKTEYFSHVHVVHIIQNWNDFHFKEGGGNIGVMSNIPILVLLVSRKCSEAEYIHKVVSQFIPERQPATRQTVTSWKSLRQIHDNFQILVKNQSVEQWIVMRLHSFCGPLEADALNIQSILTDKVRDASAALIQLIISFFQTVSVETYVVSYAYNDPLSKLKCSIENKKFVRKYSNGYNVVDGIINEDFVNLMSPEDTLLDKGSVFINMAPDTYGFIACDAAPHRKMSFMIYFTPFGPDVWAAVLCTGLVLFVFLKFLFKQRAISDPPSLYIYGAILQLYHASSKLADAQQMRLFVTCFLLTTMILITAYGSYLNSTSPLVLDRVTTFKQALDSNYSLVAAFSVDEDSVLRDLIDKTPSWIWQPDNFLRQTQFYKRLEHAAYATKNSKEQEFYQRINASLILPPNFQNSSAPVFEGCPKFVYIDRQRNLRHMFHELDNKSIYFSLERNFLPTESVSMVEKVGFDKFIWEREEFFDRARALTTSGLLLHWSSLYLWNFDRKVVEWQTETEYEVEVRSLSLYTNIQTTMFILLFGLVLGLLAFLCEVCKTLHLYLSQKYNEFRRRIQTSVIAMKWKNFLNWRFSVRFATYRTYT